MKEMRHIKIKSMRDIQLAKEIYRYEAKVYNQAFLSGVSRFKSSFKSSMENTLRIAFQDALIFGIQKLATRK